MSIDRKIILALASVVSSNILLYIFNGKPKEIFRVKL